MAAGSTPPPDTVTAGTFVKIYDPGVGAAEPWYINDHTIIRGRDGGWHLFGITHAEPAAPAEETEFAHATAQNLTGPWVKQAPVLTADPDYGETHLWAPYAIEVDDRYYLFYAGGGPDRADAAMNVATSDDLFTWTRLPSGPLFRDGYDARDPMVIRIDDRWVMYYTATSAPSGGNHVVAYRTSPDLLNWSDRQFAYVDPAIGTEAGGTESPFVVSHDGFWYLFIGPRPDYVGTDIFRSADPLQFHATDKVGHLDAHAAEVVQDGADWWVTGAGWGQGGVFLAPLTFTKPSPT